MPYSGQKTQQTADLLEKTVQAKDMIYFYSKQYVSRSVLICMRTEPAWEAWTLTWKQAAFCTDKPTGKYFYINGKVTRENLTLDFGHPREGLSSSAHLTSKLHCAFSQRHVSRNNPLTLSTRNYLHIVSGAHSHSSLPSFNKERIPEDCMHA